MKRTDGTVEDEIDNCGLDEVRSAAPKPALDRCRDEDSKDLVSDKTTVVALKMIQQVREGKCAINKNQLAFKGIAATLCESAKLGKRESNIDLLKRLSLNSGLTITKKPIKKPQVGGTKTSLTWKDLSQNKLKRDRTDRGLPGAQSPSLKKAISKLESQWQSAADRRRKKGFTTEQFFKEFAADAETVKVPRNSNKEDRVYCKVCKIFIGRPYFYNHVKYVHKNVRNHLCQDCGYRAQTGHILRQHIESQHSGTVLPCSECSMTFTCAKRLRFHINKHHSGRPIERKHVCQYCGKAFTTPHYLKNHIRVHTQETPYQCQFCERKFKFKWACKTHERLHTGVKPYKCTYCGEAFTQNCVRKNHEYRFHGNEEFNPKNRIPKEGNRREKRMGKQLTKVQPLDFLEVITADPDDSDVKTGVVQ